jgi:glycosyltransferase involved in cell wall biosynthesis
MSSTVDGMQRARGSRVEAATRADTSERAHSTGVRVAHIATTDLSLEHLLLHQLEALRSAGYDTVGISASGPGAQALEAAGTRHIAVPMSRRFTPLTDLRGLFELWRVFRRERFDIVHTHTPKAGLLGQYAALLAGVPLRAHTIHGLTFHGPLNPRVRFALVLLERVTMLFSNHNFCQSAEDIPVVIQEKISRADRVELIGNGIDLALLDPSLQPPAKRSRTREALGLTNEHKVVGVIARLVAEKGYFEMFRAAQRIREREPRARFIFVGGLEPEKADAIKLDTLKEFGLQHVAQFLGHRRDVPDLLAIMDVHVLPSHREGFPRSPMEASAMGIPSVVTNVRGCRQTVDDRVTGRLVPAKDASALAEAILELLGDPDLRRRYGAAARQKALREFDERVVFRRITSAYERLLASRR